MSDKDQSANVRTTGQRIAAERDRLGYSISQFAVLLGISRSLQEQLESGAVQDWSSSYGEALQRVGADPMFALGYRPEPAEAHFDLLFDDGSFATAVGLLRRSCEAVDAFFGEGVAKASPALVAALMNATLRNQDGRQIEDAAERIASAISGIAEALCDLHPAD